MRIMQNRYLMKQIKLAFIKILARVGILAGPYIASGFHHDRVEIEIVVREEIVWPPDLKSTYDKQTQYTYAYHGSIQHIVNKPCNQITLIRMMIDPHMC